MTPTRALRVLVSGSYAGCAGHVDRAGAARPDEPTITRLHSHAFRKKVIMVIFAIIVVSILLLILCFAVTVAGGRAHDRQNARRKNDDR